MKSEGAQAPCHLVQNSNHRKLLRKRGLIPWALKYNIGNFGLLYEFVNQDRPSFLMSPVPLSSHLARRFEPNPHDLVGPAALRDGSENRVSSFAYPLWTNGSRRVELSSSRVNQG